MRYGRKDTEVCAPDGNLPGGWRGFGFLTVPHSCLLHAVYSSMRCGRQGSEVCTTCPVSTFGHVLWAPSGV